MRKWFLNALCTWRLNSWQLPAPREASPPPDLNQSTEYVHPCPHCIPGNPYDWRCPQPIWTYPLAMLIVATGMSYLYQMNVGLGLFFSVKTCLPSCAYN